MSTAELINLSPKLKGKDWEEHLLFAAKKLEEQGELCMNRYGVMASQIDGQWTPIPSLPDFEGCYECGIAYHFIIEAKVCSQSKYTFSSSLKERQLKHMLRRSQFGSVCAIALHWNERFTQTKRFPVVSYLFPVYSGHSFWESVKTGDIKGITRDDCAEHGQIIHWDSFGARGRRVAPQIREALLRLEKKPI